MEDTKMKMIETVDGYEEEFDEFPLLVAAIEGTYERYMLESHASPLEMVLCDGATPSLPWFDGREFEGNEDMAGLVVKMRAFEVAFKLPHIEVA
jgi:hypothetical protein